MALQVSDEPRAHSRMRNSRGRDTFTGYNKDTKVFHSPITPPPPAALEMTNSLGKRRNEKTDPRIRCQARTQGERRQLARSKLALRAVLWEWSRWIFTLGQEKAGFQPTLTLLARSLWGTAWQSFAEALATGKIIHTVGWTFNHLKVIC